MAKTTTIWILTLTLALSTAQTVFACSCAPLPEPAQALEQADAVFTGTVLEVTPDLAASRKTVRFRVEKTWKGAKCNQEVTLSTGFDEISCGNTFEAGQTYLVYAFREKGKLQTNICTRTRPFAEAGDDLNVLGAPQEECTQG